MKKNRNVACSDAWRRTRTEEIATDVMTPRAAGCWRRKRARSDRMFEVTGIPRSIVPERLLESQQAAGCLLPSWLSAGDCVQDPWRRAAAIKR
ncbi:MAG: hypothetical protein ACLT1K_02435 [[Clostridium] leptum]